MAHGQAHGTGAAAAAGLLASAGALAAGELIGGLSEAAPSPVQAVGAAVVNLAPAAMKDFAVATFGTADKPALLIGIVVVSVAIGALLGLLSAHRRGAGVAGIALFGALGLAAGLAGPSGTAVGAFVSALGATAAGVTVLVVLMARWDRAWGRRPPAEYPGGADRERRDFLRAAGATGVLAVAGGGLGRRLSGGSERVEAQRQALTLPSPATAAPPAPPGLAVRGVTPLYVPNSRFYRIDTALTVPRVDLESWRLKVGGPLAAETRSYSYDDLLAMDLVEQDVTLSCVSNEVGGDLVGNARWLGVALRDLLAPALAGRDAGSVQIVGRSVDRFTAGFPAEALDGDRIALVALAMNGEPLPAQHGFPARLVVAGLYGYVSATKWLASIDLQDPAFDAYWVPRGWAKEAPVKTQSRIDVPRIGDELPAGRVAVAGVAWSPTHGIEAVEVRVDDGPWEPARLSESIGAAAWRQWVREWDATPGEHLLAVRATDGRGQVQTERFTTPRPDGATGHHTIRVRVV